MTGPVFISEAETGAESGASFLGNFSDGIGLFFGELMQAVSADFWVLLLAAGILIDILIWLLLQRVHPFPWEFSARVVRVCDGDTVWVRIWYGRRLKLRLLGIDAPESEQAFGKESQRILEDLIGRRQVRVRASDRDAYGRYVSALTLSRTDVSLYMIEEGAAWPYYQYLSRLPEETAERYREAGKAARRAGRGLWKQKNPETPWEWRRRHRTLWVRFVLWLKRMLRGGTKN